MIHRLRNSYITVFLQYDPYGDEIDAQHFEVEDSPGLTTLRFKTRPADARQREADLHLHSLALRSIHIPDTQMRRRLHALGLGKAASATLRIEILSKAKRLTFTGTPGEAPTGGLLLAIESAQPPN
ncbi:MAG: hypothetical protein ABI190_00885 [Casimicrobiaceae bacterium]